jgi:hypothetical protein
MRKQQFRKLDPMIRERASFTAIARGSGAMGNERRAYRIAISACARVFRGRGPGQTGREDGWVVEFGFEDGFEGGEGEPGGGGDVGAFLAVEEKGEVEGEGGGAGCVERRGWALNLRGGC